MYDGFGKVCFFSFPFFCWGGVGDAAGEGKEEGGGGSVRATFLC